eukprot:5721792-Ditylum_brightwellii.AAC.1
MIVGTIPLYTLSILVEVSDDDSEEKWLIRWKKGASALLSILLKEERGFCSALFSETFGEGSQLPYYGQPRD